MPLASANPTAEHDRLTRLDLTHELGADGIERAGLRGDDGAAVRQASQAEGADPERVTDADQRVFGEAQEAISTLQPRQRAAQDRHDVGSNRVRNEFAEDLGVARGLESNAMMLEVVTQQLRVR